MKIGAINDNQKQVLKASALAGGISAGLTAVSLPKETKSVLKMGKDAFVKARQSSVAKINKEVFDKTTDVIQVGFNAGKEFSDIKMGAAKKIGKNAALAAGLTVAGLAIGHIFQSKIQGKQTEL